MEAAIASETAHIDFLAARIKTLKNVRNTAIGALERFKRRLDVIEEPVDSAVVNVVEAARKRNGAKLEEQRTAYALECAEWDFRFMAGFSPDEKRAAFDRIVQQALDEAPVDASIKKWQICASPSASGSIVSKLERLLCARTSVFTRGSGRSEYFILTRDGSMTCAKLFVMDLLATFELPPGLALSVVDVPIPGYEDRKGVKIFASAC